MSDKAVCLNPIHKDREAAQRGLCKTCYSTALKAIKEGQTTWEKLIRAGKAIDAQKPKPRTDSIRSWLLEEPEPEQEQPARDGHDDNP